MMMTGTPWRATTARHLGVALQSPDVVDDSRAVAQRPVGDISLHGVDRNRAADADDGGKHLGEPPQLLVDADSDRIVVRTRGLRTDVDHVGALIDHRPGMGDRRLRIEEPAAVGK